jgi:hypothetical protein
MAAQVWAGNVEAYQSARVVSASEAVDAVSGRSLRLCEEARSVMEAVEAAGCPIAIASASPAADTALRLLRGFGLPTARQSEIYPGKKDAHLTAIAAGLHVSLRQALFFDDLRHNIRTAEALGVGGCVQVQRDGLTAADMRMALAKLRGRGRGAALLRGWLGSGAQQQGDGPGAAVAEAKGGEPPARPPSQSGATASVGEAACAQRPIAEAPPPPDNTDCTQSFDTFDEFTPEELAQLECAERTALDARHLVG